MKHKGGSPASKTIQPATAVSEDKPKHPGGRPEKLTPDIQKKLADALKAGSYIEVACQWVGITRRTFYYWMEQGQRDEAGPHYEFFHTIQKALSEAEVGTVANIRAAGAKNWQALAWIAERRWRERWARNVDLNCGPDGGPIQHEHKVDLKKLSYEELVQLKGLFAKAKGDK